MDEELNKMLDEEAERKVEKYKELSLQEKNVIFVGRLANYEYKDMDVIIDNALKTVSSFRQNYKNG